MLSLLLAQAAAPNPMLLPIQSGVPVSAPLGWSRQGRESSLADAVKAADGKRFVFVGETHDNPYHHQVQADVIEALAKSGRDVVVGFEMFTRDNQRNLAPWTMGRWTEEQFIEESKWKTQWGFPYEIYRPIFEVVRKRQLPMAALNLPREWVRRIGRQGVAALTPEEKKWAPDIDLTNQDHRTGFNAMIGGHPMAGPAAENMYAAMVAWDEGMATSAADWMSRRTGNAPVMVIVAGLGHGIYGQGINYRLRKKGHDCLTIICVEGSQTVSSTLGHYVVATPAPVRKAAP